MSINGALEFLGLRPITTPTRPNKVQLDYLHLARILAIIPLTLLVKASSAFSSSISFSKISQHIAINGYKSV